MSTKNKANTLTGIAATMALLGFLTIVTTASAAETNYRINKKPTTTKLIAGGTAIVTAAGLLVLKDKYEKQGR